MKPFFDEIDVTLLATVSGGDSTKIKQGPNLQKQDKDETLYDKAKKAVEGGKKIYDDVSKHPVGVVAKTIASQAPKAIGGGARYVGAFTSIPWAAMIYGPPPEKA